MKIRKWLRPGFWTTPSRRWSLGWFKGRSDIGRHFAGDVIVGLFVSGITNMCEMKVQRRNETRLDRHTYCVYIRKEGRGVGRSKHRFTARRDNLTETVSRQFPSPAHVATIATITALVSYTSQRIVSLYIARNAYAMTRNTAPLTSQDAIPIRISTSTTSASAASRLRAWTQASIMT